jgi:hypothetical protein
LNILFQQEEYTIWTDSKQMPLRLTQGSELQADAAYADYLIEDMLAENGIRLSAHRKGNSPKKTHPPLYEMSYIHAA